MIFDSKGGVNWVVGCGRISKTVCWRGTCHWKYKWYGVHRCGFSRRICTFQLYEYSKGANAKAKANAAQGIPEMLVIANDKEYEENRKDKHSKDAKYGWYSYTIRFALPVYGKNNDIERYNVFRAIMLIRHAEDNRLYLYDIMKIKKETSTHFQSKDLTQ